MTCPVSFFQPLIHASIGRHPCVYWASNLQLSRGVSWTSNLDVSWVLTPHVLWTSNCTCVSDIELCVRWASDCACPRSVLGIECGHLLVLNLHVSWGSSYHTYSKFTRTLDAHVRDKYIGQRICTALGHMVCSFEPVMTLCVHVLRLGRVEMLDCGWFAIVV